MSSLFINAGLLGGLALVALPVLIHLINMLRHRRVRWGAMEFLLASQKKNRTWVRFKELLLLLLRMLAVAAVVLILAQPIADSAAFLNLFNQQTQHIVLLDDSFSMSDRWSGSTAFERAKQAIIRIGQQAALDSAAQDFTLLPFSAAHSEQPQPALLQERVGAEFGSVLAERLPKLQVTDLATPPHSVLDWAPQLLGPSEGRRRVFYLVSDFRHKDWDRPGELLDKLKRLADMPAEINFVQCADAQRPNLAITSIEPDGGIPAAGVEIALRVSVANYGSDTLQELAVNIEEDGVGRPPIRFDRVASGRVETQKFQVNFSTAGEHVVSVRLDPDTVSADNQRQLVLKLPLSNAALVVDGGEEPLDAFFLSSVFAPGGAVRTGVDVQVERPSWLNNNALGKFSAVYLCNVERLDPPAIESLEKYIADGGGVAFFLGDRCRTDFYNTRLYRDGAGCFPLPLVAATPLLVDRLDKSADIDVVLSDHPVFRVFSGERNSFLNLVNIERFIAAPKTWQPQPDSTTRVIARLRNGSPLAVERRLGEGLVLAFTTTASPLWNNWARGNPSYPVTLLELQSYLMHAKSATVDRLTGSPIAQSLPLDKYQRRARFVPPQGSATGPESKDLRESAGQLLADFSDTSTAGVYELQLTDTTDQSESRRFALNVDPREGDLALLDGTELASRLPGLKFTFRRADQFALVTADSSRANLSDLILYVLIALLIGEQALAYAASYHPAAKSGGRA